MESTTTCSRCSRQTSLEMSYISEETQSSFLGTQKDGWMNDFFIIQDTSLKTSEECFLLGNCSRLIEEWIASQEQFTFCTNCIYPTMQKLESLQAEARVDHARYISFLQNLEQECAGIDEKEIDRQIAELRQKQISNKEIIQQISEAGKITENKDSSNNIENDFWMACNQLENKLAYIRDKNNQLNAEMKYYESEIQRLQSSTAWQDIFILQFDHSTPESGKINGLRLGKIPLVRDAAPSEAEISGAFGQCALLLHLIQSKIGSDNFRFSFSIQYRGDKSTISTIQGKEKPLFFESGTSIFRPYYWFSGSELDQGITTFVASLKKILDRIKKLDKNFSVPYEISDNGTLIDSSSVEEAKTKPEDWTATMKKLLHILHDLKEYASERL